MYRNWFFIKFLKHILLYFFLIKLLNCSSVGEESHKIFNEYRELKDKESLYYEKKINESYKNWKKETLDFESEYMVQNNSTKEFLNLPSEKKPYIKLKHRVYGDCNMGFTFYIYKNKIEIIKNNGFLKSIFFRFYNNFFCFLYVLYTLLFLLPFFLIFSFCLFQAYFLKKRKKANYLLFFSFLHKTFKSKKANLILSYYNNRNIHSDRNIKLLPDSDLQFFTWLFFVVLIIKVFLSPFFEGKIVHFLELVNFILDKIFIYIFCFFLKSLFSQEEDLSFKYVYYTLGVFSLLEIFLNLVLYIQNIRYKKHIIKTILENKTSINEIDKKEFQAYGLKLFTSLEQGGKKETFYYKYYTYTMGTFLDFILSIFLNFIFFILSFFTKNVNTKYLIQPFYIIFFNSLVFFLPLICFFI